MWERHYIRHVSLAQDGLIITTGDSQIYTTVGEKNKIMVPHKVAPGLLYHLHNKTPGQHPPMSQLKTVFNRTFYTWNLQSLLDSLYKNCYVCSVIQKQPLVAAVHKSKTQVKHPHRYFHADIIRRNGQFIMLLVHHFLNLAQATVLDTEKARGLKNGFIDLSTPVRHPAPIEISTDNAIRFQSLEKNTDPDLQKLQISVSTTAKFNKNYNAVVDKACQEFKAKLRKIRPEGGKVTATDLAQAMLAMNLKLRRKEGVVAYKMHTARKLDTGQNLQLNDNSLRQL